MLVDIAYVTHEDGCNTRTYDINRFSPLYDECPSVYDDHAVGMA